MRGGRERLGLPAGEIGSVREGASGRATSEHSLTTVRATRPKFSCVTNFYLFSRVAFVTKRVEYSTI